MLSHPYPAAFPSYFLLIIHNNLKISYKNNNNNRFVIIANNNLLLTAYSHWCFYTTIRTEGEERGGKGEEKN